MHGRPVGCCVLGWRMLPATHPLTSPGWPSPHPCVNPFLACVCVPGFHAYQRMIGCELLEDGNNVGFLQYAYHGQDFIVFNRDMLS